MSVMPTADVPSWTDVGGFIANSVLALSAIAVTIMLHFAENRRVKRAVESEKRQRRAEFAKDLIMWFELGTKHLAIGGDSGVLDDEWARKGRELEACSELVDSPGAKELMRVARTAREEMEPIQTEQRGDVAISITRMMKLWASGWVDNPDNPAEYPVAEWVKFAASEKRAASDEAE